MCYYKIEHMFAFVLIRGVSQMIIKSMSYESVVFMQNFPLCQQNREETSCKNNDNTELQYIQEVDKNERKC